MLNTPRDVKPIAVLANRLHEGFNYLFQKLKDNVAEYNNTKQELFDRSGGRYIVITRYEQLLGAEIKDFWIAPGFGFNPDAERITELAGQRLRK